MNSAATYSFRDNRADFVDVLFLKPFWYLVNRKHRVKSRRKSCSKLLTYGLRRESDP